ncbi:hypothetical protein ZWY2020_051798 [Hordeum vulgare]|nr:hypothetical protein ZWY2020_051798 [Hordeum vulgare]
MNSFLGFGREYVAWNFEKSENPMYIHIVQPEAGARRDRSPAEEANRARHRTIEWCIPPNTSVIAMILNSVSALSG